jgi:hypothetical protein
MNLLMTCQTPVWRKAPVSPVSEEFLDFLGEQIAYDGNTHHFTVSITPQPRGCRSDVAADWNVSGSKGFYIYPRAGALVCEFLWQCSRVE